MTELSQAIWDRAVAEATILAQLPPRDPTQVPPPLKDDVGKHNESEFNTDDDAVELEDEDDEDSGLRDDDED